MNVDRMLSEISRRQLLEWMVYADLEPFDEVRGDLRAAMVSATIANINRKKGSKAYGLEDFLLKFGEKPFRTQTWQQQKEIMRSMYLAYSAEQKKRPTRPARPRRRPA